MKNLFKYASLLLAAVMLFSCHGYYDPNDPAYGGGEEDDANAELKISSDRNLIQTFGGDHANIIVTLGKKVITEDVIFFDGNNQIVDLPDFKFYASEPGEYELWANYGTYNSEKIAIKATSLNIPSTPVDPQPNSTDFKTRVLLTEFTTTGCTQCPNMKKYLHEELRDNISFSEKVVLTECHSSLFNGVRDACYLHDPSFEFFCGAGNSFPMLKYDLDYTFNGATYYQIKDDVEKIWNSKISLSPGIAVNSILEKESILAKVTVKARVDGQYRVGAFLVEDGVFSRQSGITSGEEWLNTHDNVIRYIDAKHFSHYYGHPIAEISSGETADILFSWELDDIWEYGSEKGAINGGIEWAERNNEKLHMVVFVSMNDNNGDFFVANAIDCPVNGQTPYEYR